MPTAAPPPDFPSNAAPPSSAAKRASAASESSTATTPSDPAAAAPEPARGPIAATIAAVIRDGHVLLVRRANPPDENCWAFPGGKIHAGEPLEIATARELLEETGVVAEPLHVFDAVDVFDRDDAGVLRRHFILIAMLCRWQSGEPVAGDDARDARWVPLSDLEGHRLATSFGVARLARNAAALTSML